MVDIVCFPCAVGDLRSHYDFVGHLGAGQPRTVRRELIYKDLVFSGPYVFLVPAAASLVEKIGAFRRRSSVVILAAAGLVFIYLHVAIVSIPVSDLGPTYKDRFWRHSLLACTEILKDFAVRA
jgi:hypothetical protein